MIWVGWFRGKRKWKREHCPTMITWTFASGGSFLVRVVRGSRLGQCPVIVSTLMSGELKCPTRVRACVSRALVAPCGPPQLQVQQVHSGEKSGKGVVQSSSVEYVWWKRAMVYSEHRFLPNLGGVPSHEELPASDTYCQAKDESLGDKKHFSHIFVLILTISSHPWVFCHNFLADTGYSSVPCSIEEKHSQDSNPKVSIWWLGFGHSCQYSSQLLTLQLQYNAITNIAITYTAITIQCNY